MDVRILPIEDFERANEDSLKERGEQQQGEARGDRTMESWRKVGRDGRLPVVPELVRRDAARRDAPRAARRAEPGAVAAAGGSRRVPLRGQRRDGSGVNGSGKQTGRKGARGREWGSGEHATGDGP